MATEPGATTAEKEEQRYLGDRLTTSANLATLQPQMNADKRR